MYYAGQSGIAGAVGNLAGVSFPINESSRTRQIRGIRNLQEELKVRKRSCRTNAA